MSLPYDNATAGRLGGTVAVKSGGSWRFADRVWVKKNNAWGSVEAVSYTHLTLPTSDLV